MSFLSPSTPSTGSIPAPPPPPPPPPNPPILASDSVKGAGAAQRAAAAAAAGGGFSDTIRTGSQGAPTPNTGGQKQLLSGEK